MGLSFVLHLIFLFSFSVISNRETGNLHLDENANTKVQSSDPCGDGILLFFILFRNITKYIFKKYIFNFPIFVHIFVKNCLLKIPTLKNYVVMEKKIEKELFLKRGL